MLWGEMYLDIDGEERRMAPGETAVVLPELGTSSVPNAVALLRRFRPLTGTMTLCTRTRQ